MSNEQINDKQIICSWTRITIQSSSTHRYLESIENRRHRRLRLLAIRDHQSDRKHRHASDSGYRRLRRYRSNGIRIECMLACREVSRYRRLVQRRLNESHCTWSAHVDRRPKVSLFDKWDHRSRKHEAIERIHWEVTQLTLRWRLGSLVDVIEGTRGKIEWSSWDCCIRE